MAEEIARLYVGIGGDNSGLKRALDETKTGLQATAKQAQGFGGASVAAFAKTAASMFTLGVAIRTVGAAFEAGKLGADLLYTQDKFDKLARSMGVTADMMMGKLREATKGTVSDMDLAASASNFMSLGLAKNYDEVIRLTTVAGALGMNMNQLVLTLTNKTTMRFDALGVKVDGFKEKVAALKAAGMDADAAFKEAFLQQAEEQMGMLGNKADSTAAAFMRFDAAAENLANTFKMRLAPLLVPILDTLSGYSWQQFNKGLKASADEAKSASPNYQEYARSLDEVAKRNGYVINSNGDLVQQMQTETGLVEIGIQSNYRLSESVWSIVTAENALPDMSERLRNTAEAAEVVADNTEAAAERMDELNLFMRGPVRKENTRYIAQQREIQDALKDTASRIADLQKTPWKVDEISAAKDEYSGLQEQVSENEETHKQASRQIIFDLAQQQLAQDGLTNTEADGLVLLGEKFGLIDDATAQMWQAMRKPNDAMSEGLITAEKWVAAMERLATNWYVTVHWQYEGETPPIGAGAFTQQMPAAQVLGHQPVAAEAYAGGGSYRRGVPRLVGERGPELEIPATNGQIISNEDLRRLFGLDSGKAKTVQNINVNLNLPRENYNAMQLVRELQRLGGA